MSPTLNYQKTGDRKVDLFFNNNIIDIMNNELSIVNNNLIFDSMPDLQPILDFDDSDDGMDEVDGNLVSNANANQPVRPTNGKNGRAGKRSGYKATAALVRHQGPAFIFIEALVWNFCSHYESDKRKQKLLFLKLCQRLQDFKLIGNTFTNDTFHPIREVVCHKFNDLIREIKAEDSPLSLSSSYASLCDQNSDSSHLVEESSRYRKEFLDLGLIEEGGFGVVHKAKYRFDDCEYAVKMIRFKYKSDTGFKKITREVQLYANLSSHPNVVGYKTAWLENWCLHRQNIPLSKHLKTTETSHTTGEQMESSDEDITYNIVENDVSIHFEETSKSGLRIETSKGKVECNRNDTKEVESEEEVSDEDEAITSGSVEGFRNLSFNDLTTIRQTVNKRKKTQSISSTTSQSDAGVEYRNCYQIQKYDKHNIPQIKVEDYESNACPFACCEFGAILYIQMELCSKNLKSWLRERNDTAFKRFDNSSKETNYILSDEDIKTAKNLFRQILKGVEYIHSQHLIHRDLKPQNILFSVDDSKVKIGDFGLATLHNSIDSDQISLDHIQSTATDMNEHTGGIGTSIYAAPEQKARHPDKSYDQKTDLFSLGIILFELFYPLSTDMEKVKCVSNLTKKQVLPKSITKLQPNVAKVILALTHPNPSIRPNATQVLHSSLFLNEEQIIIRQIDEQNQQLIRDLAVKDKTIKEFENQLDMKRKEALERDLLIEKLRKQLEEMSNK